MKSISVIVPIYNVDKFLKRSIESIQNQTLKNIEIILVNDGSQDNSLAICLEFAMFDSRIKVIDKQNGGVSSARNAGIEIATGRYVGFVDPDDWCEQEMFESMYKKIEATHSEVCMIDYVIDNNGKVNPVGLDINEDTLNRKDVINQIIPNMISPPDLNNGSKAILGSVWRLLINKKLIDKYDLRFVEGIPLMEDLIFSIRILLRSQLVCIQKGQCYHYVTHNNQVISKYREDLFKAHGDVVNIIEDILIKEKIYDLVKNRLNIRYANMCISLIVNEAHKDNPKRNLEKIKTIKNICRDNRLKQILIVTNTKTYSLRKKLTLHAIKKELSLSLFLYYSIINRIIYR